MVDPDEQYQGSGSSTTDDGTNRPLGYGADEVKGTNVTPPASNYRPGTYYEQSRPLRFNQPPAPKKLYFSGDEWAPINTPQNVPAILQKLVASGLLSPDDYRPGARGAWDEKAADAYREVLTMANRYGVSAGEMLDALAQNPDMKTLQGGAGSQPPPIALTHPTELRESFRTTYRERVGKNPSQSAMDAFVNTYHKIEEASGHAMNDAAPGATYVNPPAQADAAREQIDKDFAADEHAYQTVTRLHDFYSMLDSPVQ